MPHNVRILVSCAANFSRKKKYTSKGEKDSWGTGGRGGDEQRDHGMLMQPPEGGREVA